MQKRLMILLIIQKNLIVSIIEGIIYFENDISACLKKQKEIITLTSSGISGKVIKVDTEKKIIPNL